jgi:hypothetical protein
MRFQIGKTKSSIVTLLTVIFLWSFFQYFFPLNHTTLLVPVSLLNLLAYTILIYSNPANFSRIIGEIFAPKTFLFILAVTIVPIIVSSFSGREYSVLYGCLMILTLFSIRAILNVVPIEDILSSFFYASVVAIPIFVIVNAKDLFAAITGNYRLYSFFYHPNLIAFLIGGFIPVQFWKFRTQTKYRIWILALIFMGSIIIFFSSSRGSIVSILTGGSVISAIYYFKQINIGNLKITGKHFFYAIFLSGLAMIIIVINPIVVDNVLWYITDKLAFYHPLRGLDTGVTGRLALWDTTIYALKHGSWILGNGFRSGSRDLGFSIDNGYLTLAYEIGLVPAFLVTTKYIWVTLRFTLKYLRAQTFQESALFHSLIFIMVVFLTNNIVTRYLFGLGNPFSLLGLFFLLLTRKDIEIGHWITEKKLGYKKVKRLLVSSKMERYAEKTS